MITFDKTITLDTPPPMVLDAIREVLTGAQENHKKHLIYARRDQAVWDIYYWQPAGKRGTYVRALTTPISNAPERLATAANLIRALDDLEQPISRELQDVAYEHLREIERLALEKARAYRWRHVHAVTGLVSRRRKRLWRWMSSDETKHDRETAAALVMIFLFAATCWLSSSDGRSWLLQQLGFRPTARPQPAYSYTPRVTPSPYFSYQLPGDWEGVLLPEAFAACFTASGVRCTGAGNWRGLIDVAFAQVVYRDAGVNSLESAENYFLRLLEERVGERPIMQPRAPRQVGSRSVFWQGGQEPLHYTNFVLISLRHETQPAAMLIYAESPAALPDNILTSLIEQLRWN